jgi:ankyrin repeat protein
MSNLIRIHPSSLSCFEAEDERYGLPIFVALATGSNEAVRNFFWKSRQISSPQHLRFVTCANSIIWVETNESTLDATSLTHNEKGPLSYLAEHGDDIVLAFLCASGKFNIESTSNDGRTPLSWAAENLHDAVVRLLLEQGADPVPSDLW